MPLCRLPNSDPYLIMICPACSDRFFLFHTSSGAGLSYAQSIEVKTYLHLNWVTYRLMLVWANGCVVHHGDYEYSCAAQDIQHKIDTSPWCGASYQGTDHHSWSGTCALPVPQICCQFRHIDHILRFCRKEYLGCIFEGAALSGFKHRSPLGWKFSNMLHRGRLTCVKLVQLADLTFAPLIPEEEMEFLSGF